MLRINSRILGGMRSTLAAEVAPEAVALWWARMSAEQSAFFGGIAPGHYASLLAEIHADLATLGVSDAGLFDAMLMIGVLQNANPLRISSFAEIMEHRFLHADAKARHLVLAFASIVTHQNSPR